MKLLVIGKRTGNLLLMAAAITASTSSFAADTGEQLALCKGALKSCTGKGLGSECMAPSLISGDFDTQAESHARGWRSRDFAMRSGMLKQSSVWCLKNKEGEELAS